MKKNQIKMSMVISLLLMHVPTDAFFARYKQDNIIIYSLFGRNWGWEGNDPISEKDLEFLVEKFEAERKEAKQAKIKMKQGKESRKKSPYHIASVGKTPEEIYKNLGIQPAYMVYMESQKSMMGLKQAINRWFFNVSWHDDESRQTLSIINDTGETLFVESNLNPFDLMTPKNLKGVLNGHARRISLMSDTAIGVWRMQTTDERLEQIITKINIPYGTTLVQLSKNKDEKIVAQIMNGSDDEETI